MCEGTHIRLHSPSWGSSLACITQATAETLQQGWQANKGSCHTSAGRKKQPRACFAGLEKLKGLIQLTDRSSRAKTWIWKKRGGTGSEPESRVDNQPSSRKQGRHMPAASGSGGPALCPGMTAGWGQRGDRPSEQ